MKELTILDGGMGRELKRIGAPFSQPLWSAQALIEAPHYVTQTHQSFVDAGAQLITVNSYACVPFHLGETLFAEQGANLATQAAAIAKEVAVSAQHKVQVVGSLPPVFGSYRPDLFDADNAFDILNTLFIAQDQHVDAWLGETISSIAEAKVMLKVLASTTKPCHFSFTLSDDLSGKAKLRSGELVTEAIEILLAEEITGIFFNCSIPEVIEQALKDTQQVLQAKQKTDLDIGVFANSFTPIPKDHKANEAVQGYRDLSPLDYLGYAKQWYALGANIIGGCCGIRPDHIKALANWQASLIN